MRPLLLSSIVLLASAAAYINARSCGFAFDDAFAITYNGDVTDPLKPLSALLEHDFWGQDIRGEGSHKSFRRAERAESRRHCCWPPAPLTHCSQAALRAHVSRELGAELGGVAAVVLPRHQCGASCPRLRPRLPARPAGRSCARKLSPFCSRTDRWCVSTPSASLQV